MFLALIVVQAAHSTEEYAFELYQEFAPVRFISGLVSNDPGFRFALLNAGIVAFGFWCYSARVRTDHASANAWMWVWIAVSLGNGIVHSLMALLRHGYFPGVVTAPLLFVLAALLAEQLRRGRQRTERAS